MAHGSSLPRIENPWLGSRRSPFLLLLLASAPSSSSLAVALVCFLRASRNRLLLSSLPPLKFMGMRLPAFCPLSTGANGSFSPASRLVSRRTFTSTASAHSQSSPASMAEAGAAPSGHGIQRCGVVGAGQMGYVRLQVYARDLVGEPS